MRRIAATHPAGIVPTIVPAGSAWSASILAIRRGVRRTETDWTDRILGIASRQVRHRRRLTLWLRQKGVPACAAWLRRVAGVGRGRWPQQDRNPVQVTSIPEHDL